MDNFHFNPTNDLQFLLFGDEWFISIEKSFNMCVLSHISYYYDGNPPTSIHSITTKTFPELNILKYFHDAKNNINFFTHDWANKVLRFCTTSRHDRALLLNMSEIIPNYNKKDRVLKSTYDILRRSLKWFLYCLWINNAVLLPVTLSFPKSSCTRNGREPLFNHYPELMKILRSPYCMNTEFHYDIISHINSCGFSEFQIRDYAYKIITSSTWRRIEDISISNAFTISKNIYQAMSLGMSKYNNHLPVIPLLKLVASLHPSRCCFDFNDISQLSSLRRKGMAKESNYSAITDDINPSKLIWEDLHTEFISTLNKRGMSKTTIRLHKRAFYLLKSQIFDNNPSTLIYPNDYTRSTFIGKSITHPFHEKISMYNVTHQYSILKKLEVFFDWLSVQTHIEHVSGFVNPICKFDYPRTSKPKGTNKIIPSARVFSMLYSFLSTTCEFYWWLISNNKYHPGQALTKDCYDTESMGMIPIVWIDGRAYPIFYIPCRLTGEAISSINNKRYCYPIFQTLFSLFVEFETGLRTTHICWLSIDDFDKYCKNNWNDLNALKILPELKMDAIMMVVSSDKVKTAPWESYVSSRVIRMLKRLKFFLSSIDGIIPDNWYNNTPYTPHGKLRSIFHLKEMGNIQGAPLSYDKIRFQFRRLQLFFDLWQKTHQQIWLKYKIISLDNFEVTQLNPFSDITNHIYNKNSQLHVPTSKIIFETFHYSRGYKTDYTPHGIRASVVSQKVTLLPPDVIAKYITGHESINALLHYVVINDETLTNLLSSESKSAYKDGIELNGHHTLDNFKARIINRRMHTLINKNPQEFHDTFFPISFKTEPSNNHKSYFNTDVISDASFFTTHICPYNKICPEDVVTSIGHYMCGQCYASIKTIAHIPRILAHMRSMNLDLSVLRNSIKSAIAAGADPEAIAPLDYKYRQLANELAAWVHTYGILKANFDNPKTREKYFLANPDQVTMNIIKCNDKRRDLALFILMLNDAHQFVEYNTPNLKAQITSISNKIKMNHDSFTNAISSAGDYTLLDELRGLIKSCSEFSKVSYIQALDMLLSNQPVPTHIQLE
ncbi:hypothetical protein [Aeromonas veronii]|uniref:hypothetical protein n=1 Tax=Aeromonas veronii TaxID=654 RepID=UPI000A8BEE43|nr:hypothetical protein [Aeromonas veronii]